MALIYLAFKLNYRAARLYETIELTPARFLLTRVHPSGRTERFDCNPYWASVRLREWPDGRTDLGFVERGRELMFGRFLNDDERRGLAGELQGGPAAGAGRREYLRTSTGIGSIWPPGRPN